MIVNRNLLSGERGSRSAIWRWLCLLWTLDIEEHSAATSALTDLGASTMSVIFLGLRKSQDSLL